MTGYMVAWSDGSQSDVVKTRKEALAIKQEFDEPAEIIKVNNREPESQSSKHCDGLNDVLYGDSPDF